MPTPRAISEAIALLSSADPQTIAASEAPITQALVRKLTTKLTEGGIRQRIKIPCRVKWEGHEDFADEDETTLLTQNHEISIRNASVGDWDALEALVTVGLIDGESDEADQLQEAWELHELLQAYAKIKGESGSMEFTPRLVSEPTSETLALP